MLAAVRAECQPLERRRIQRAASLLSDGDLKVPEANTLAGLLAQFQISGHKTCQTWDGE